MRVGGIEQTKDAYKITYTKPQLGSDPSMKKFESIQGISLEGNKITINVNGLKTEFHVNEKLAELLTQQSISNHLNAPSTLKEVFNKASIKTIEKNELSIDFDKTESINEKQFSIKKKGGLYNYIRQ